MQMCGEKGGPRPIFNQIEPRDMPLHQSSDELVMSGESGRRVEEGDRVVTFEGFIARVKYRRFEGGAGDGGLVDLAVAGMPDRISVPAASCSAVPTLGGFLRQLASGELLGPIPPPEGCPQAAAAASSANGQHAAAGSSPETPANESTATAGVITGGSPSQIVVFSAAQTRF